MQIFIMRHGDASLNAINDSIRSLTSHGHKELGRMTTWLKNYQQDINIECVLVSPYLRAKQTLAKLREQLKLPQQDIMVELTPYGNLNSVIRHLQSMAYKKVNSVLIISHLPLVVYLISALCEKKISSSFPTSSIACIDFNAYTFTGKLKWLISPSTLLDF